MARICANNGTLSNRAPPFTDVAGDVSDPRRCSRCRGRMPRRASPERESLVRRNVSSSLEYPDPCELFVSIDVFRQVLCLSNRHVRPDVVTPISPVYVTTRRHDPSSPEATRHRPVPGHSRRRDASSMAERAPSKRSKRTTSRQQVRCLLGPGTHHDADVARRGGERRSRHCRDVGSAAVGGRPLINRRRRPQSRRHRLPRGREG